MTRVLTERELNRALLARQRLLEHDAVLSTSDAIRHLGGLQAQEPKAPYVGLWSRLAGFDPAALEQLLETRDAVRVNVMRGTIHLVNGDETAALRDLHADMLRTRGLSAVGRHLPGVDLDDLAQAARPLFAAGPVGMREVGRGLQERFDGCEAEWLGIAAASAVPVVHTTPRGLWRRSGRAQLILLDAWLDGAPRRHLDTHQLLHRYLEAFGPATPADFTAWSGLPGARTLFDEAAADLVTYADEQGRTLYDLPGLPLPPAETPAPPRFLPEFDNALQGHADRTRILPDAHRQLVVAGERALLLDGVVAGRWWLRDGAVEVVTADPTDAATKRAIRAEAEGLPGRTGRITIRSGTGRTTTASPSRTR